MARGAPHRVDAQPAPGGRAAFAVLAIAGEDGHTAPFASCVLPLEGIGQGHHHQAAMPEGEHEALVPVHEALHGLEAHTLYPQGPLEQPVAAEDEEGHHPEIHPLGEG